MPDLSWVERATGGRVVRQRPLRGGIIARVLDVRVELPSGVLVSFVVRSSEHVDREARTLAALADVPLPTPELVAVHHDQVLLTKLPGHADLAPEDLSRRMRLLADPLPVLHGAASLVRWAEPWTPYRRALPWVSDAGLRRAAEDLLAGEPPMTEVVACHGDYQHFNLLWSRGRLTGIVDWSGLWLRPPDRDVSHCRLNLAVLHGPEPAELFRRHWEALVGRRIDPWWDVHGLAAYGTDWPGFIPRQVAGRAPLSPGMTERVEALLRLALA